MLVRDPDRAGGEAAAHLGAEGDRRSVGADRDGIASRDLAALRVVVGELDLGCGALELELGDPLDGRAGEERPVAEQAERSEEVLGRSSLRRRNRGDRPRLWLHERRACRKRRPLTDLAEAGLAAEDRLRQLGEDERRMRRELDAEALGELRDPGELVRHGRNHASAQALDATLRG